MFSRHLKRLAAAVMSTDSAGVSQGMVVAWQHRAVCDFRGVIYLFLKSECAAVIVRELTSAM